MTVTARNLVVGTLLTGAAVKLYTAPVNTRAILKSVALANPTGGAVSATIFLVPSGGTPVSPYNVVPPVSIAASGTLAPPTLVNQVLEAATELWAQGAGLTIRVSGVEIA